MNKKRVPLLFALILAIILTVPACNRAKKVISQDPKVKTPSLSNDEKIVDEPKVEEPETTEKETDTPAANTLLPFGPEECNIFGVKLDMNIEDVKKMLGEPDSEKRESNEVLGGETIYLYYPSLELCFDPYIGEDDLQGYSLAAITIKDGDIPGPRNLKVGDSAQSVIDKFPNENHGVEEGTQVLYGESFDLLEHGYIYYDENGNIECISYLYGYGGFGTYGLNFYIKNDIVQEIVMSVANI